jgi:hypothetical protein
VERSMALVAGDNHRAVLGRDWRAVRGRDDKRDVCLFGCVPPCGVSLAGGLNCARADTTLEQLEVAFDRLCDGAKYGMIVLSQSVSGCCRGFADALPPRTARRWLLV